VWHKKETIKYRGLAQLTAFFFSSNNQTSGQEIKLAISDVGKYLIEVFFTWF